MRKFKYCILLIVAAIACLTACKKNNDVVATVDNTRLSVINATTDPINIYLNGTRQNSTSGIYTGGSTGYLTIAAGTETFAFKHNFNNVDFSNTDTLFTLPLTLPYVAPVTVSDITTSYAYSLFVTGNTRSDTFLTKDTLTANSSSLPEMRFINAAPTVPNLQIKLDGTVLFTSNAYKSVSTFQTLASSGDKVITVINTATGGTIYTTTVSLTSSSIYTLVALGTLKGTGTSAFRVGLLTNQ
ncbi:DUF4397 domain-containing protein [Mucilaginibacter robiniae]|uniref:DUF4397 domain-containing protein n=1 Tax=Mucilaginibacter robiniae TaxID=2728022 RepID=A0A7L5DWI3_9SPHI|nr:DUF4397 domain-containing protein [Mucilaginibacter robiniae]QJD95111.1 DUF4397 domain-containing protein [Mucilaginibacter robiniae]